MHTNKYQLERLFNVYDDTNGMKWFGKIYDATFREIEKLPEIDEN